MKKKPDPTLFLSNTSEDTNISNKKHQQIEIVIVVLSKLLYETESCPWLDKTNP